jgi:hypothetical protein
MIEVPTGESTTGDQRSTGLDYSKNSSFVSDHSIGGIYLLPEVSKTDSQLPAPSQVFVSQDSLTLNESRSSSTALGSVLDLSVLNKTSIYREANRIKAKVSSSQAENLKNGLAEITAAYQKPAQKFDNPDCDSIAMSVRHRIRVDTSKVLEIVESEVSANPGCACEIVKVAIKESGADVALVADITEVAITSSPESMRMISQCAIAAMPEALAAVQAVLAKLDQNSGDSNYSAKDSKSGKDAKSGKDGDVRTQITPPEKPADPLDLPPVFFPPIPPPPVYPPPPVTNPNP